MDPGSSDIEIRGELKRFRASGEPELVFPPMPPERRRSIWRMCMSMGLESKSRGKDPNRFVTITRKDGSAISKQYSRPRPPLVEISDDAIRIMQSCLKNRETERFMHLANSAIASSSGCIPDASRYYMRSKTSRRVVPRARRDRGPNEQSLPVFAQRDAIVEKIMSSKSQVFLVSGETGCGKTTQIPQFILDHHSQTRTPCMMTVTQPRRIAAMSVAQRVAQERGEKIGETVGYQIRLEARRSSETCLLYCTTGVLLRTLADPRALADFDYIILDEVHEREQFTDFLITHLREQLPHYPRLKVLLMTATMTPHQRLFRSYFPQAEEIHIPVRTFEVKEWFLEDILRLTGYERQRDIFSNPKMCLQQLLLQKDPNLAAKIASIRAPGSRNSTSNHSYVSYVPPKLVNHPINDPQLDLRPSTSNGIANHTNQSNRGFRPILGANSSDIRKNNLKFGPPQSEYTPQSSCQTGRVYGSSLRFGNSSKARGSPDCIVLDDSEGDEDIDEETETDSSQPENSGRLDHAAHGSGLIANRFDNLHLHNLADAYSQFIPKEELSTKVSEALSDIPMGQPMIDLLAELADEDLLKNYAAEVPFGEPEFLDQDMLIKTISLALAYNPSGAILVFLPGYEDILSVKDTLEQTAEIKALQRSNGYTLEVIILHSQVTEDGRLFGTLPSNKRKLILATNIAEASVTIPDVVSVVDCGKVKELYFDSFTNVSQLRLVNISKSSAIQRKGRSGRCQNGTVFRLYSRKQFNEFSDAPIPELLRISIHEACIQTRLMIEPKRSVADFLKQSPQPPPEPDVENSINFLKMIGVFDEEENLTDLGLIVSKLPVAPQLGVMLWNAIRLRVIDPVLSVVAALTHRDPFATLNDDQRKPRITKSRLKLGANTFSDHFALYRLVAEYEEAMEADAFAAEQKRRNFVNWNRRNLCSALGVSYGIMEMITGIKKQIIGEMQKVGLINFEGRAGCYKDMNRNCSRWPLVKAALTAGAYPSIGICHPDKPSKFKTRSHHLTKLHPTCLAKAGSQEGSDPSFPLNCLIYHEVMATSHSVSLKTVTPVSTLCCLLFAGNEPIAVVDDGDDCCILELEDSNLNTCLKSQSAAAISQFRVLVRLLRDPQTRTLCSPELEELLIDSMNRALCAEDLRSGMEIDRPNEIEPCERSDYDYSGNSYYDSYYQNDRYSNQKPDNQYIARRPARGRSIRVRYKE